MSVEEKIEEAFHLALAPLLIPDSEKDYLLRKVVSALRAEGLVIVLREPTEEMLLSCQAKQAAAGYTPNDAGWLREIYRSMLAAIDKESEER